MPRPRGLWQVPERAWGAKAGVGFLDSGGTIRATTRGVALR